MTQKNDHESGALNAAIGFLSVLLCLLIFGLLARLVYPHIRNKKTEKNRNLVSNVIQVAVLNGCGVSGVGDKLTTSLRNHGFDVVKTGNFRNFEMKHTTVISRLPDPTDAEKVAKALGIDKVHVITEASKNYYLDAAIVIGEDYQSLKLK
jgi:hypothetical protein